MMNQIRTKNHLQNIKLGLMNQAPTRKNKKANLILNNQLVYI